MPRTTEQEINDLSVRLEDGGLPTRSARIEAERIVASIIGDTRHRVASEILDVVETDLAYRPKWERGMRDAALIAMELLGKE